MSDVNKIFLNNDLHNNEKELVENTIYKESLINGIPPKAHNIPTKVIGIAEDGSVYEKVCESCAYEIKGE